jgi:hypothetical protein
MSVAVADHDRDLYDYAIHCAFYVLIGHAERRGCGWYHLLDGELFVAAEVTL